VTWRTPGIEFYVPRPLAPELLRPLQIRLEVLDHKLSSQISPKLNPEVRGAALPGLILNVAF